MVGALIDAGNLAAAESACAAELARCRNAGDVFNLPSLLILMADLDVQAGRFPDAAAHLREGLQIAVRAGDGGMSATACGTAHFCASRPGAMPKPPRCGPPTVSISGSRESSAGRRETPAGRKRR